MGIQTNRLFLVKIIPTAMLYHFELQMAGVILLTAMTVCGIFVWSKRRRESAQSDNPQNSLNEPSDQQHSSDDDDDTSI